ncbi:hypothetical protein HYS91_04940 [Candidatus Daviesbacteria bacterium]|nr:hypothetical protein [Candidatus Daviesbacteria bacterium]
MVYRMECDANFAGPARIENGARLFNMIVYQDDLPGGIDYTNWTVVEHNSRGRRGKIIRTGIEAKSDRVVLHSHDTKGKAIELLHERFRDGLRIIYTIMGTEYWCKIFPVEQSPRGPSEAKKFIDNYGWHMPTYGSRRSPRR